MKHSLKILLGIILPALFLSGCSAVSIQTQTMADGDVAQIPVKSQTASSDERQVDQVSVNDKQKIVQDRPAGVNVPAKAGLSIDGLKVGDRYNRDFMIIKILPLDKARPVGDDNFAISYAGMTSVTGNYTCDPSGFSTLIPDTMEGLPIISGSNSYDILFPKAHCNKFPKNHATITFKDFVLQSVGDDITAYSNEILVELFK
ncbi:MAG: hypothetical protein WCK37_01400 [Candidatus Falkowbacteria bacterium]